MAEMEFLTTFLSEKEKKLETLKLCEPDCPKCRLTHLRYEYDEAHKDKRCEWLPLCPVEDLRKTMNFSEREPFFFKSFLGVEGSVFEFSIDPEIIFFKREFIFSVFEDLPFHTILKLTKCKDVSELYEQLRQIPSVVVPNFSDVIISSVVFNFIRLFTTFPRPLQDHLLTQRKCYDIDERKRRLLNAQGLPIIELFLTLSKEYCSNNTSLKARLNMFDWTDVIHYAKSRRKPYFRMKGGKLQIPYEFHNDLLMDYVFPYKHNAQEDINRLGILVHTPIGVSWMDDNWKSHLLPKKFVFQASKIIKRDVPNILHVTTLMFDTNPSPIEVEKVPPFYLAEKVTTLRWDKLNKVLSSTQRVCTAGKYRSFKITSNFMLPIKEKNSRRKAAILVPGPDFNDVPGRILLVHQRQREANQKDDNWGLVECQNDTLSQQAIEFTFDQLSSFIEGKAYDSMSLFVWKKSLSSNEDSTSSANLVPHEGDNISDEVIVVNNNIGSLNYFLDDDGNRIAFPPENAIDEALIFFSEFSAENDLCDIDRREQLEDELQQEYKQNTQEENSSTDTESEDEIEYQLNTLKKRRKDLIDKAAKAELKVTYIPKQTCTFSDRFLSAFDSSDSDQLEELSVDASEIDSEETGEDTIEEFREAVLGNNSEPLDEHQTSAELVEISTFEQAQGNEHPRPGHVGGCEEIQPDAENSCVNEANAFSLEAAHPAPTVASYTAQNFEGGLVQILITSKIPTSTSGQIPTDSLAENPGIDLAQHAAVHIAPSAASISDQIPTDSLAESPGINLAQHAAAHIDPSDASNTAQNFEISVVQILITSQIPLSNSVQIPTDSLAESPGIDLAQHAAVHIAPSAESYSAQNFEEGLVHIPLTNQIPSLPSGQISIDSLAESPGIDLAQHAAVHTAPSAAAKTAQNFKEGLVQIPITSQFPTDSSGRIPSYRPGRIPCDRSGQIPTSTSAESPVINMAYQQAAHSAPTNENSSANLWKNIVNGFVQNYVDHLAQFPTARPGQNSTASLDQIPTASLGHIASSPSGSILTATSAESPAFNFAHHAAAHSAPTNQNSVANLWTNIVNDFVQNHVDHLAQSSMASLSQFMTVNLAESPAFNLTQHASHCPIHTAPTNQSNDNIQNFERDLDQILTASLGQIPTSISGQIPTATSAGSPAVNLTQHAEAHTASANQHSPVGENAFNDNIQNSERDLDQILTANLDQILTATSAMSPAINAAHVAPANQNSAANLRKNIVNDFIQNYADFLAQFRIPRSGLILTDNFVQFPTVSLNHLPTASLAKFPTVSVDQFLIASLEQNFSLYYAQHAAAHFYSTNQYSAADFRRIKINDFLEKYAGITHSPTQRLIPPVSIGTYWRNTRISLKHENSDTFKQNLAKLLSRNHAENLSQNPFVNPDGLPHFQCSNPGQSYHFTCEYPFDIPQDDWSLWRTFHLQNIPKLSLLTLHNATNITSRKYRRFIPDTYSLDFPKFSQLYWRHYQATQNDFMCPILKYDRKLISYSLIMQRPYYSNVFAPLELHFIKQGTTANGEKVSRNNEPADSMGNDDEWSIRENENWALMNDYGYRPQFNAVALSAHFHYIRNGFFKKLNDPAISLSLEQLAYFHTYREHFLNLKNFCNYLTHCHRCLDCAQHYKILAGGLECVPATIIPVVLLKPLDLNITSASARVPTMGNNDNTAENNSDVPMEEERDVIRNADDELLIETFGSEDIHLRLLMSENWKMMHWKFARCANPECDDRNFSLISETCEALLKVSFRNVELCVLGKHRLYHFVLMYYVQQRNDPDMQLLDSTAATSLIENEIPYLVRKTLDIPENIDISPQKHPTQSKELVQDSVMSESANVDDPPEIALNESVTRKSSVADGGASEISEPIEDCQQERPRTVICDVINKLFHSKEADTADQENSSTVETINAAYTRYLETWYNRNHCIGVTAARFAHYMCKVPSPTSRAVKSGDISPVPRMKHEIVPMELDDIVVKPSLPRIILKANHSRTTKENGHRIKSRRIANHHSDQDRVKRELTSLECSELIMKKRMCKHSTQMRTHEEDARILEEQELKKKKAEFVEKVLALARTCPRPKKLDTNLFGPLSPVAQAENTPLDEKPAKKIPTAAELHLYTKTLGYHFMNQQEKLKKKFREQLIQFTFRNEKLEESFIDKPFIEYMKDLDRRGTDYTEKLGYHVQNILDLGFLSCGFPEDYPTGPLFLTMRERNLFRCILKEDQLADPNLKVLDVELLCTRTDLKETFNKKLTICALLNLLSTYQDHLMEGMMNGGAANGIEVSDYLEKNKFNIERFRNNLDYLYDISFPEEEMEE